MHRPSDPAGRCTGPPGSWGAVAAQRDLGVLTVPWERVGGGLWERESDVRERRGQGMATAKRVGMLSDN